MRRAIEVPMRRPQTARGEQAPAVSSARRAASPRNAGAAPYRTQRGERVSYSGTNGYSPREPPVNAMRSLENEHTNG
eukprot:3989744-Amphidinium_carterae.1